jgi:RHS repeat-associated protein
MQDNRWCYAGKEAQNFGSLDLSLLDFGARMYDPFIARWTAVDPLASKYQSYSPNNYCLEDPVIHQDTDGRIVANIIGAAIGAATEVTMQVIAQKVSGASLKEAIENIDYLDVGVAAAEGFVTAGTSAIKNTAVKTTARIALSAASAAAAGKFDYTSEKGLSQNSNLQATVSAVTGLIAGSANFSGKAKQVLKPKTNSTAVEAAREVAHQEGKTFSKNEAKAVAVKNEARNAYVKRTNEGTKEAVNSIKNSAMELPNYLFWEKVKDN